MWTKISIIGFGISIIIDNMLFPKITKLFIYYRYYKMVKIILNYVDTDCVIVTYTYYLFLT